MENYLNNLKAAIINRNLRELEKISKEEPNFKNIEEAKEIQAYIKKAIKIFEEEKNRLLKDMQKIDKIKNYTL